MKTEGLTLVEAWQALLDGKCIAFGEYTYKISDNALMLWAGTEYWLGSGEPLIQGRTFSIVPDPSIPEPKSLTAEEAVDLLDMDKKIKVSYSATASNILELGSHFEQSERFHQLISFTSYLDLAERRGWSITEVST